MRLKRLIYGAIGALMLGGSALAAGAPEEIVVRAGFLPGVFNQAEERPVILAQSGDPTVQNLEEQVRQLNGRIEDMNYQILQMQEQLRKMQEDVDFRLQEIEDGKKSDAGTSGNTRLTDNAPADEELARPERQATANPPADGGSIINAPPADSGLPGVENGASDPTVQSLGSITFDENGNVMGGGVGDQSTIGSDPNGAIPLEGADNTVVAALPKTDNPEELYRSSYEFMLGGQYATAEAGFADHAKRFPSDVKAADARFWLGEAQLGQRKYRDAAETFLTASKEFPKSKKAPEMLLKLGVSLIGLDQRDVACATFAEIGKRYPSTSGALKDRVAQERAQASC